MTFVPKDILMNRRLLLAGAALAALRPAWAHHGWSSFDQTRPLYPVSYTHLTLPTNREV